MNKCDICGATEDVITTNIVWGAWGHNAFDFNWCKYIDQQVSLCPDCEGEEHVLCRDCDAAIPAYDYGKGYLPDDYEDEDLCPECAGKRGLECHVHIGPPPWHKSDREETECGGERR